MRTITFVGCLIASSVALPASQVTAQDGLYARIEKRLAENPGLGSSLGQPAPEMAQAAWLVGEWDIEAAQSDGGTPDHGISRVSPIYDGTWLETRDTYPSGNQDLSYLGFSAATGRWTSVSIDSYGNANIVTSTGWQEDCLAFEGDFLILGEPAHLRQTLCRTGADSFRIGNEELVGGEWRPVDSYTYRRKAAP